MIELHIANDDVSSGTVAVSWCVDQDALAWLHEMDAEDPQVVIVISPVEAYHNKREVRKVVSLKDLMTYVEFRSSGANKIWAVLSTQDHKDAKDQFLDKNEDGDYTTNILLPSGDSYSHSVMGYESPKARSGEEPFKRLSVPLQVEVPAGVFAKEPAKWEKTWVNYWFRSKTVDQCHFRRRRLLAYTVQPVAVVVDLMARMLMMLLASLWLSRGLSLKYLLHPLTYNLVDTAEVCAGGSWAIGKECPISKPNWLLLVRRFYRVPLIPIAWVPVILLTHFHLWKALLIVLCTLGVVVGFVLFCMSSLFKNWADRVDNWLIARSEAQVPWYMSQKEMDAVVCSLRTKKYTSIDDLPANHRTIHLRFQDLKSRVCKPFSR